MPTPPGEFSTLQNRDPYGLAESVFESMRNPIPTLMNGLIPQGVKSEIKDGNRTTMGEKSP